MPRANDRPWLSGSRASLVSSDRASSIRGRSSETNVDGTRSLLPPPNMHAHASELRPVGAKMARNQSKSSVDVSCALFSISGLARTPQILTRLASARHTNTLSLAKLCQSPF